MALNDIVAVNAVIPALKVNGKKQAIQEIAARAAELSGLSERTIFETLLQREKLGSTGIGHGIAIPHGKLPKLDRLFGLFARLDRPIDFESLDGQPVDLIFLLLAPGRRGRRSSQGARARCATAARSRHRQQAARVERRRCALCGADDDAVEGGLMRSVDHGTQCATSRLVAITLKHLSARSALRVLHPRHWRPRIRGSR